MEAPEAPGENQVLAEGPGQEALPALPAPAEVDVAQLQAKITELEAQVKVRHSYISSRGQSYCPILALYIAAAELVGGTASE